ncbi:MAG: (deoxy)nucleoside triphosphate pyrophosphohydrolase [Pseudomonadota bacterium]
MVETSRGIGKKTDMTIGPLWVVAGALQRADQRWLMHRRPEEKHHGGLWEFPGGKVEPYEMPQEALIRELAEELGIAVDPVSIVPLTFAQVDAEFDQPAIVILLYKVTHWDGEPQALEGGAVDWLDPITIGGLPKPPLDSELCARLFYETS